MSAAAAQRPAATADRLTLAFAGASGVLIVAGGLVAAVNSAAPFDHGSWLAAYLVLVGGVAQAALGVGRLALPAPLPAPGLRRAQLGLFNAGALAVPAGVLAGAPGLVLAGSVVLLAALGCFAAGAAARPLPVRALAYHAGIAALVSSVAVGSALAGAV